MRSESVVRLSEIDFQTGPEVEGRGEGAGNTTLATRGVVAEVVVCGGVVVPFVSVKISTFVVEPVKKSFVGEAVPVVSEEPSVAVLHAPV